MILSKHNKKGQIEAQFNWIFILVVGGIIMLFFTTIVIKQKSTSEQKLSATVISDLEAIFIGASVSKGTSHLLEVPEVDLDFDCTRFYLGSVNKPLGKQVVFAPSRVKGTKILTWTLEWNMPFKVTNFLYITSPEMRYIFIYDTSGVDLIDTLKDSLPKDMNTEFYDYYNEYNQDMPSLMDSIKDKNNYKVRLIFVGSFDPEDDIETYFPLSLSEMNSNDLTAMLIDSTSDPTKLYFYKAGDASFELIGETTPLDYVSLGDLDETFPSLYGAIFSDELESYNCVMRKAFERLALISDIYLDKTNQLETHYSDIFNQRCETAMGSTTETIGNIKSSSTTCTTDFPDLGPSESCVSSIMGYVAGTSGLDTLNKKLLLYSCALIY